MDGWIVCHAKRQPRHAGAVGVLGQLLFSLLPAGWFARVHTAVTTRDSVPEPDLAVVRGKPGDYRDNHPTGADVGLLIEVADATVERDRAKALIYARADIPQYWIVNLDDRQVEIHSQPAGPGRKRSYRTREVLRGRANVEVILNDKAVGSLAVREILGS